MSKTKNIRIAINGFGRIGRAAFKIALLQKDIEVVAINDLTDPRVLAHLLQYDTVYGKYDKTVTANEQKPVKSKDCVGSLRVGNKNIPVLSQKEPNKLPWKALGVDVVIESTGFFTKQKDAKLHLKAGARAVVISAPAKDEETQTYVRGVNTGNGVSEKIVSNASCTTNCISPVVSVVQDAFGIEKAMMTTIHSYTSTQNIVDGPHKDPRRGRAAAQNIVPTTTGAAIATTKAIPELAGKFDGMAVRVPTIDGSISDITMIVSRDVTEAEVNKAFVKASKNPRFKNILSVTDEPLVSSDIIGSPYSAIVDVNFTKVVDGNMLKVLAWYDNEWGYSNRLVEMVREMKK